MIFGTIVYIRTPHWGNTFARRRLEERLDCDTALSGSAWLIDYEPTPKASGVHIISASLSRESKDQITELAMRILSEADVSGGADAPR